MRVNLDASRYRAGWRSTNGRCEVARSAFVLALQTSGVAPPNHSSLLLVLLLLIYIYYIFYYIYCLIVFISYLIYYISDGVLLPSHGGL